jgi:hypothetical protein
MATGERLKALQGKLPALSRVTLIIPVKACKPSFGKSSAETSGFLFSIIRRHEVRYIRVKNGPDAIEMRCLRYPREIVLQNSFWINGDKLSGLWAWRSNDRAGEPQLQVMNPPATSVARLRTY